MVKFIEKELKSILNKNRSIDSWFWDRYTVDPYIGCQFGCIYCDARNEHYLPTKFENDIIVKKNASKMLDKRLSNRKTLLPDVVVLSGATDPYQPAEKKFKNTRQCLEILEKHKYPVHIITKSNLVLEDLDLLEEIGKNNWCCISITIPTSNSTRAIFLEKKAPSPQVRFEMIKTIKQKTKHIQIGILFIPVVPFLCDSEEIFEDIVKNAKESKADYVLFAGDMTMRDDQAKWFLQHLSKRYPELIERYEELYQFKYKPDSYEGNYEPKKGYIIKIHKRFFALCEKYQIPYRIKRFIPHDFREKNYLIAQQLLNEAYKLQMLGKHWSKLYWAGEHIQNLKESIVDIARRNELHKIRGVNEETEAFISMV